MNSSITLKFANNSITVEVADGTTVGQILANPNYRAVLGFGDNVEARVEGVTLDANTVVRSGDSLYLSTRAASKA
jgi:hypothetical protein